MKRTTLCYLERNNKYLMLHRNKKENDINLDKWIGVGGKLMPNESIISCLKREVKEETGYIINSFKSRAIIFFHSYIEDEIMFLFTCDDFYGEEIVCNEGDLEWIDKSEILSLNLWEGDKFFLNELFNNNRFFFLYLYYDKNNHLISHHLGGNSFKDKVYEVVSNIPYGKVSTYGEVAILSGYPKASRAVGNALHNNPYDGIVPCHRVLNSKGELSKNFGINGTLEQEKRLKKEGIIVLNGKVDLKKYSL